MSPADFPRWHYSGSLVRVKDGDSAEIKLDLGLNVSMTVPVRIIGLQTPELRGPDAIAARAAKLALHDLLAGRTLYVRTHKDARSFERYLGLVFIESDDRPGELANVADLMIAAGHGTPHPAAAPGPGLDSTLRLAVRDALDSLTTRWPEADVTLAAHEWVLATFVAMEGGAVRAGT